MDGVYAIITNIKEKGVFMSEINSFNKFIIGNRCTREEYLEAVSYYEKTATDAEKKDFDFVKRNLDSKVFNLYTSLKFLTILLEAKSKV